MERSEHKFAGRTYPALIFRDFKGLKLVLGSIRAYNLRRTSCSVSYTLIEGGKR